MVDCIQLRELAERGPLPLDRGDAAIRQHLERCEVCDALFGADAALGSTLLSLREDFITSDEFGALDQLLEREAETPRGRFRALSTPLRRSLVVAAGLLVCLGTYALWRRPNFELYPAWRMLIVLGSLVVLGALTTREVLRPLSLPSAPRRARALLWTAFALPFVFALLPEVTGAPSQPIDSGHGAETALLCLAIGVASALPSLGLVWLCDRSRLPAVSQRFLVAGAGGLFANAMLQLHCPYTAPAHLVSGHAMVGVLLLALTLPRRGWALG